VTTTYIAAWLFAALLGLLGSALASGMETGGYCVNRIRLRLRAAGGTRGVPYSARLLLAELEHPQRLLATLLITNNVFNFLAATAITALLTGAGYGDAAAVALNAGVLTPILVVFAESLPKELFRVHADRLTHLFAPHLTVARLLLTWLGVLPMVHNFAEAVSRLVGGEGGAGLARTGRERVAAMLKETAGTGPLSPSQTSLVDRAIEFQRMVVADEMVPWARVEVIGIDWDRGRILAVLARRHYSWFPAIDARGRVVGAMRHMDLYVYPGHDARSLMREPARLAPGMPLREAIRLLRQASAGVGIVESGGKPVGLVTIKDLVEPLTGELLER
jgi:putative hemolysin